MERGIGERPGVALALDVGTKTIGLAKTDPEQRMAFPWQTLARQSVQKDAAALAEICRRWQVRQVVVGLPLELDGGEGRTARLARQVAAAVEGLTGLPIAWVDERFSTVEAKGRLREAGLDERQQRGVVDAQAAAVILQDWLDSQG
jgi:putative Holliday junction resolvase